MGDTVYDLIEQIEAREAARRRAEWLMIAKFVGILAILNGLPLIAVWLGA